jgi:hypothetical protein
MILYVIKFSKYILKSFVKFKSLANERLDVWKKNKTLNKRIPFIKKSRISVL